MKKISILLSWSWWTRKLKILACFFWRTNKNLESCLTSRMFFSKFLNLAWPFKSCLALPWPQVLPLNLCFVQGPSPSRKLYIDPFYTIGRLMLICLHNFTLFNYYNRPSSHFLAKRIGQLTLTRVSQKYKIMTFLLLFLIFSYLNMCRLRNYFCFWCSLINDPPQGKLLLQRISKI